MELAKRLIQRFFKKEDGSILVEALLAIPVVTILTFGILEYGNVLWQRQQVQTGVRDAARYWSKCRPLDGSGAAFMPCSIDIARNIAFYGDPAGLTGLNGLRVPGWDKAANLVITPLIPPTAPSSDDLAKITGIAVYNSSPVFALLQIPPITITYEFQMRYIGW
jgi:hypothetical protein